MQRPHGRFSLERQHGFVTSSLFHFPDWCWRVCEKSLGNILEPYIPGSSLLSQESNQNWSFVPNTGEKCILILEATEKSESPWVNGVSNNSHRAQLHILKEPGTGTVWSPSASKEHIWVLTPLARQEHMELGFGYKSILGIFGFILGGYCNDKRKFS